MCYVSYRAAIEEEVKARVKRRENFTAYTITCALREQGFREPHAVLKEVVHCLFRYGKMSKNYRRTFVRFENGHEAFLFHHRSHVIESEPAAQVVFCGLVFSATRGAFPNRFGIARARINAREI